MGFFSKLFRRKCVAKDSVTFDDDAVVRTMSDGTRESIRWADLRSVRILTTDEGPLVTDLYWLLEGDSGGCAVPSGADGHKALLARLQQLPGFDNDAVIQAMGSTSNAEFVCWTRAEKT